MKNLMIECPECEGCGYVTIDLNDTYIPYEQKLVDYTCMLCDGKSEVLCKDKVEDKIMIVDDIIQGMQDRMRVISDTIMFCKKGLLHELSEKYVYRLDTCARGLGRLLNYRKKLHNLVA
jgi:hypothetical protein